MGKYHPHGESSIYEAMPYIAHIQISMPYLNSLINISNDILYTYKDIFNILNDFKYSNNISLEMKSVNLNEICKSIYNYALLLTA